jgi:hypothetical protein
MTIANVTLTAEGRYTFTYVDRFKPDCTCKIQEGRRYFSKYLHASSYLAIHLGPNTNSTASHAKSSVEATDAFQI